IISAGVGLVPPAAFCGDSFLFIAEATESVETRFLVLKMDDQANLSFSNLFKVGPNPYNITVSPNGRVVISSCWTSPTLSIFFIKDDATITSPSYLNNPMPTNYNGG